MRYTIFKRGGYNQGTIGTTGGDVAGKVILSRDPIGLNEASTKNYVDVKFNTIPVSSVIGGIVNSGRVPEFAGDIVKLEGNNATTVKTTTVAAGTYPKVTVNIKGQVTGGGVLVEGDIPVLPWTKFATGKPVSLGGFGIIDALNNSGGVFTGGLKVSSVSNDAKCLINKGYMDSLTTGGVGITTGGVVYRNSAVTPTGFLRCNGGEVSKTTYAALYSVIGDAFGGDLMPGSGRPWQQQYAFNNEVNLNVATLTLDGSLPIPLGIMSVVVTKNRVYLLGGWNGTAYISSVYTASIYPDGNLGNWTSATSLPGPLGRSQAIVTKNRVYLLGGYSGISGTVATVYHAPINSDGTIGTWVVGDSLPSPLGHSQAVVTKNRVYLLGGHNDTNGSSFLSTVYTAQIDSSGFIGAWSVAAPLPGKLAIAQAVVTKSRVYLMGGYSAEDTDPLTIWSAAIGSDGLLGSWVVAGNAPSELGSSEVVVTNNKLYVLSGRAEGILSVDINPDGTLGAWVTLGSIPYASSHSVCFTTKTKLYLMGGHDGVTSDSVYSAPFLGGSNDYSSFYDGTIAAITDSTKFRLPDYTPSVYNANAYIRF